MILSGFISLNLYSQTYLADSNLSSYFDITPDTLINYACMNHFSTESYCFDINADAQDDLRINAGCGVSPGQTNISISVKALNTNSYIRFGRLDSSQVKVAKPLLYGDSINPVLSSWDNTTAYFTRYISIPMLGYSVNIKDWVNANDQYLGIKYQNTTDTIYGWIRLGFQQAGGCLAKDHSFGSPSLGTKEASLINSRIYPNPATDKIYIECTNNNAIEISLFDIAGKQVRQPIKTENPKTEIDVRTLHQGIYFVKVNTSEGVLTKKIVVHR